MAGTADFYLKIKGQKQGEFKTELTQKGREGQFLVYSWAWEVHSPRDAASGLATGKRQHKPLVVTVPIGKASPLVANAMVQNENLSEVTLLGWNAVLSGKAGVGAQKQYYTIKLTNANIASIKSGYDSQAQGAMSGRQPAEEISFTYQKIEWTYTDGGVMANDDWESPVA